MRDAKGLAGTSTNIWMHAEMTWTYLVGVEVAEAVLRGLLGGNLRRSPGFRPVKATTGLESFRLRNMRAPMAPIARAAPAAMPAAIPSSSLFEDLESAGDLLLDLEPEWLN